MAVSVERTTCTLGPVGKAHEDLRRVTNMDVQEGVEADPPPPPPLYQVEGLRVGGPFLP